MIFKFGFQEKANTKYRVVYNGVKDAEYSANFDTPSKKMI